MITNQRGVPSEWAPLQVAAFRISTVGGIAWIMLVSSPTVTLLITEHPNGQRGSERVE